MTMARKPIKIDRDKLRAEVRKLGNERIFYLLDDAIGLLPPARLQKLVRRYIAPERMFRASEGGSPMHTVTKIPLLEVFNRLLEPVDLLD